MSLIGKKEFKNASWLIGGRVLQMLLSLFINLITARYLGPTNFGLINYANSFVAFFTSLCNLGLNYIIIKELIINKSDQGKVIGTSIGLRAISSVLSIFAIWAVVNITDTGDSQTILVVLLCSAGVLFNVLDTFNYWFQIQYKSRITATATLIGYIVLSIYRIILLILKKDIVWFALAASIDYAVIGIVLWIAYRINKGPHLSFSLKKGKMLLSQSYHYILSGMMVTIYGQTDKFMLRHLMSYDEVGYYSSATVICAAWVFVLTAIIDSMFPTICYLHGEKNEEAFKKKNRQLYSIVFYISLCVSIFFRVGSEFVVGLMYGQDYLPAANSLRILTWYTAFAYLGVARNAWLTCKGKQKYEKYIYSIAAILNIGMNFVFIPILGAEGAAIATFLTQLFTCIIIPSFFKELRPNVKLMIDAITLRGIF